MRDKKKQPFSKSRSHSKYKVTNWKAILMCMQIRYLFGLKLRQAEGFINWIFETSGIKLTSPDYTTLSKRGKALNLDSISRGNHDQEFDHVCMDSTGIQTYTGNEWLENKHGKQYIRRTWKKLHIVVGDHGMILANSTTTANSTTKPPKAPKTDRHISALYQEIHGYQPWRVKNDYGRREKVENTFFRFKTNFGSKFSSREDNNRNNEITIKCDLLNKMFKIGQPISAAAS